jgi:acyl-coenzyme A thioesterase PaaI-like protein
MDYELLRDGLARAVPFNEHVGIEILELSEGRGVVRLPDEERLRNFTGSQQAAALFAAGEAAAVAALVATFGEALESLRPRPDGAQINYKKIANGPITAIGVLGAAAQEVLDELERAGRTTVAIDVSLVNAAGDVVAELIVRRTIDREA